MGARCCKGENIQRKTFSEQQTQTDDDLSGNIYDPNNMSSSRESNLNNNPEINQQLPPKENDENNNKINIENDNDNDNNNNKNPESNEPMAYQIYLKDYLDEKIDNTEIFENKWYNDIEKGKIIYSKRVIVAMINKAFDEKNEDFKEIYNKPPLTLSIKSTGSFITDEFQVSKNVYIANKNSFPKNTSIKMISKYMLNTKERMNWDPQLKSYTLIEGSEEGKEIKCILHNWTKSPMFLVSERDCVDKRYDFFHEGIFYSFESSVNDDYIPLDEKVTRINDIIFIQQVYEENENIIFKAVTQMNAKVSLPQAIINATLSGKLLDFYKGVIDAINRDFDEGKLIFEDNGCGMSEETLQHVTDPFFTTRTVRKVGLGIPLLKQNCEKTGGRFSISSQEGIGTEVHAVFSHKHIDRPTLGDIATTIVYTASAYPDIRFIYKHIHNDKEYIFDTQEITEVLDGISIQNPEIIAYLVEMIRENLKEINVEF